ncbi:MAG TPA: restriction endonuclease subunit S [Myxococcaceae bacterium]|nr:restriction endonuclease subunit S [Myxococcaceae bacterium]
MSQTESGARHQWPVLPLRDVVETLFVGLPVSRHQAKAGQQALHEPVLSVGDIEAGQITPREQLETQALRPGSLERFRIQADDLLVSCRGTILKVARVPESAASLLVSSNLIVVRPSEKLLPAVLLALFRSAAWQRQLHLRARSSATLVQLTVRDLENLDVPLPSIELQHELAKLIESEEEHHQAALRAVDLRRALVDGIVADLLLPTGKGGAVT